MAAEVISRHHTEQRRRKVASDWMCFVISSVAIFVSSRLFTCYRKPLEKILKEAEEVWKTGTSV